MYNYNVTLSAILNPCRDASQTSMAAENLLIDNRGNGQTIKTVCEGLPELYVEPALA